MNHVTLIGDVGSAQLVQTQNGNHILKLEVKTKAFGKGGVERGEETHKVEMWGWEAQNTYDVIHGLGYPRVCVVGKLRARNYAYDGKESVARYIDAAMVHPLPPAPKAAQETQEPRQSRRMKEAFDEDQIPF